MPGDTFHDISRMAEASGISLFSDEVYRESEYRRQERLPAACDLGAHAVSLGVMSKTYGLAGLRIGWIATQNKEIYERMAVLFVAVSAAITPTISAAVSNALTTAVTTAVTAAVTTTVTTTVTAAMTAGETNGIPVAMAIRTSSGVTQRQTFSGVTSVVYCQGFAAIVTMAF